MESELRRILRRHSRSLTDAVAGRLTTRSSLHYRKLDPDTLSLRCQMLVEALIESTYEGAEHLGEFVATVANQRLAEGFELEMEELQHALRVLEVESWRIVVSESKPDSATANLAALNTAMGYARDELARVCQLHAFATAS